MSQLVKTKRQANFKGFKRFGAFKALPQSRYSFNVMLKVTLTLMLCYTQKLSFFFTMMLCSLDVI
jgi:hypothetical protein